MPDLVSSELAHAPALHGVVLPDGGLGRETQEALERGARLVDLLRQQALAPYTLPEELAALYVSRQRRAEGGGRQRRVPGWVHALASVGVALAARG